MENLIVNPIEQIKKYQNLKETYGFVNTEDMLIEFYKKGWVKASEDIAGIRRPDKLGYQKHLIRLEHPDFKEIPGLTVDNKSIPQLCLLNSHDGATSFQMFLGLVRVACLNGIIAGTAVSHMKLVHSKHIMKRVPDAIDFMSNAMPQMIKQIQLLSGKSFSAAGLAEFTKTCVDIRLKNVKNIVAVNYQSANKITRSEDYGQDAFTVMNRIQESVLRGGIDYSYIRNFKDKQGNIIDSKLTNTRTRCIRSVSGQVKLNRLVYDKALEMAV